MHIFFCGKKIRITAEVRQLGNAGKDLKDLKDFKDFKDNKTTAKQSKLLRASELHDKRMKAIIKYYSRRCRLPRPLRERGWKDFKKAVWSLECEEWS